MVNSSKTHTTKSSVSLILRPLKKRVKSPKIVVFTNLSSLIHEIFKVVAVWQPKSHHNADFNEYLIKVISDPAQSIDTALSTYVSELDNRKHTPLKTIPFDPDQSLSGNVWHHGSAYEVFIKGAPEQILTKSDLTENEREQAEIAFHKLASNGQTVIGIAHGTLASHIDMVSQLSDHPRLHFDGFIAIQHTVNTSVRRAINQLRKNGVVIIVLTGSHQATASHIARELGIVTSDHQVLDCRHSTVMSDETLREAIGPIRVFTRTDKETQQRIINLLPSKHTTIIESFSDLKKLANK